LRSGRRGGLAAVGALLGGVDLGHGGVLHALQVALLFLFQAAALGGLEFQALLVDGAAGLVDTGALSFVDGGQFRRGPSLGGLGIPMVSLVEFG